jgi:hypothetical protein
MTDGHGAGDQPRPWIDPELAAHSGLFERGIHRIGERVWCAVGEGLVRFLARFEVLYERFPGNFVR